MPKCFRVAIATPSVRVRLVVDWIRHCKWPTEMEADGPKYRLVRGHSSFMFLPLKERDFFISILCDPSYQVIGLNCFTGNVQVNGPIYLRLVISESVQVTLLIVVIRNTCDFSSPSLPSVSSSTVVNPTKGQICAK